MWTLKEAWRRLLVTLGPNIRDKPNGNLAEATQARMQAESHLNSAKAKTAEVTDMVNYHRDYREDIFAEKLRLAFRGSEGPKSDQRHP